MTYYDTIASPVGALLLTGDGEYLTGLYLENHKRGPTVGADWVKDPSRFGDARLQLHEYFAGTRSKFDLPLRMQGTAFQREVWRRLEVLRFGETTTYGELAKAIGSPNASRAVGAAVGRNPVSIIVPCHRVVGSKGEVTGYAGGVDKKLALLRLEGSS